MLMHHMKIHNTGEVANVEGDVDMEENHQSLLITGVEILTTNYGN